MHVIILNVRYLYTGGIQRAQGQKTKEGKRQKLTSPSQKIESTDNTCYEIIHGLASYYISENSVLWKNIIVIVFKSVLYLDNVLSFSGFCHHLDMGEEVLNYFLIFCFCGSRTVLICKI